MTNPEANENERQQKIYEGAWAKAKSAGEEISEALGKAAKTTTASARQALERQARRAVEASEHWRSAAEGLLERLKKQKP